MSLYIDCGEAARQLLDDPRLRIVTTYSVPIFTELDVIALAARNNQAREGRPYSTGDMKLIHREASQAVGQLFRDHLIVRFGPVDVPGLEHPDYARIDGKMIYASPESGPRSIKTPNGTFKRLIAKDGFGRPGRILGAGHGGRNDLELWRQQNIPPTTTDSRDAAATIAGYRENVRLRAENAALRQALEDTRAENEGLRSNNNAGATHRCLDGRP